MARALESILKNPYLVVCLVLAIGVVGITSLLTIPADLLPQFKTPAVQIVCFYPGMPPVVMERDIMSRLQPTLRVGFPNKFDELAILQYHLPFAEPDSIKSVLRYTSSRRPSARQARRKALANSDQRNWRGEYPLRGEVQRM